MTPQEVGAKNAKVMAAWANGSSIQVQPKGANEDQWWDMGENETPSWDYNRFSYRLKPAPISENLYIAITKRGRTTNYAVILDFEAAKAYPCDEFLEVQIVQRHEGAGAS